MHASNNNTISKPVLLIATLALVAIAFPTTALATHLDYLVAQDANGRLVTCAQDFDNGNELTVPVRVFYRDLDESFFGSDPGYSAVSPVNVPSGYFALPPLTALSFDMLAVPLKAQQVSNLWYWNGDGAVDFQPASGAQLQLSVGSSSVSVNGAAAGVTGLKIQDTSATGGVHRHPSYQLLSTKSGDPAQGVYLMAQQTRMPGLLNSIPYYTLFATDAISGAAYLSAQHWATNNLVVPGDVNTDGVVNIADITVVAEHWLQQSPPGDDKYIPIGDANFDRVVNISDITMIAEHWLEQTGGSGANFAVPEPASLLLLLCVAPLLAPRLLRRIALV